MIRSGASLLALVVALGCDWRVYDDIRDQVWVEVVDARDDSSARIASYTDPESAGFTGPRFLRVTEGAPGIEAFAVDLEGAVSRRVEDLGGLGLPTNGELLVASDREQGLAIVAGRAEDGYELVTGAAGTLQDAPRSIDSVQPWRGIAVSSNRIFAITADDEMLAIDRATLEPVITEGAPAGLCSIDTSEIQGTPNPGALIAALGSSYTVVSSDGSLLEVGLPTVDEDGNPSAADPCLAGPLSADLVDGPLITGEFIGADGAAQQGPDIAGVTVGQQVSILSNWLGPGTVTPELVIDAPDDASERWGESLAVGDFDGDGDDDLAVGDPGEQAVDLYDLGAANREQRAFRIEPADNSPGFAVALSSLAFSSTGKDLLVVGSNTKVYIYFRVSSSDDNDPRR